MGGFINDTQIKFVQDIHKVLSPFIPYKVSKVDGEPVISYGLSHVGYDIRLAPGMKVFTPEKIPILDPKKAVPLTYSEEMIIPPNTSVLTSSIEYFRMPNYLFGVCIGKSTYARLGLIVNVTTIEPGWEGNLTIELTNTTPIPLKLYPHEGIAQIHFYIGTPSEVSYEGGKYQKQSGITGAKL